MRRPEALDEAAYRSTEMSSGASSGAKPESAAVKFASCVGEVMFRSKRITPPSSPAAIAFATGEDFETVVPRMPTTSTRPIFSRRLNPITADGIGVAVAVPADDGAADAPDEAPDGAPDDGTDEPPDEVVPDAPLTELVAPADRPGRVADASAPHAARKARLRPGLPRAAGPVG